MCHCEDLNTCRKSSLTRADFLYDNEQDSDVVFLVGIEPDVWRIPGHRKILTEANVVFRALLEGPLANHDKTIVIEDVEGRAFDYLLRYLYGKEVHLQSAATALCTLYAAHKYLCSGLIELCVKYLDENMNAKNVLEIYTHARLYACRDGKAPGYEPSAPEASTETCDLRTPTHCYPSPANTTTNNNNNNNSNSRRSSNENGSSRQSDSIPFWSSALVHNCLQYIDENADQVLSQETVEDLAGDHLKEIIRRDTLKIKSEYTVFLALDRWANRECKRRKLNLNSKNRRLVLSDLIFEVRFPFFTSDEFVHGPIQSGWLDQQELSLFSGLISKKSKHVGQVPTHWKAHMDKVCRKRSYSENDSVTLSQRTYLIELDKSQDRDAKKGYSVFRKFKSKNKGSKEKLQQDESERSCTKCFPDFMIDILVCLFD